MNIINISATTDKPVCVFFKKRGYSGIIHCRLDFDNMADVEQYLWEHRNEFNRRKYFIIDYR